jgi:hypothetical protein
MTTIIGGTSPSITFSDSTTQTTAFTTGSVTQTSLAANVTGNGPAFSAYQSSAQTIGAGVFTKLTINLKEFDTNSNYDNVTNYRFTPTVAGYYQVSAQVYFTLSTSTNIVSIYKNGVDFKRGAGSNAGYGSLASSIIYFNGTTDYIEVYAYANSGASVQTGSSAYTYVSACLVRSA